MHSMTWDFDRVLVYLPFIDFPIYWYGFLFATGIFIGQKILKKNILQKNLATEASFQNLILLLVVAIALGARLFDVIFYQELSFFLKHPLEIFNFRAGGLASHGGFIGFIVALYGYACKKKVSVFSYLSEMILPACILAFFIRLGNLFNQEILGKAYQGFGSIVFKKPFDGAAIIPRHPVVIYEALSYLIIGFFIQRLKLQNKQKVGSALAIIFTVRIFLEFFKEEPSVYHLPYGMTMGMVLSVPIVLIGLYFVFKLQDKSQEKKQLKHEHD